MIKIVSDSTCDLTKEIIEKNGIQIVPLHILLGDKEYQDGDDISPDEIYAWADANEDTPKTSAVGFEDVMNILQQIKDTDDEMFVFTISGKMSTTVNVFRMAAEELDLEDKVTVIDSGVLSSGIGLLLLKTIDMVKEGKNRTEIVEAIEELKGKLQVSFVVDTLTYLHRGGRCSSVAMLAGGVLKIHPKIVVEDGGMIADKKYRGKMNKVILDYVKEMEEEIQSADTQYAIITHSGCEQEIIDEVYTYLDDMKHFDEIIISRAGGVISSHCGPGTLGVMFIKK